MTEALFKATLHLVDDDDAFRFLLRRMLEALGFPVCDYATGTAFFEQSASLEGCALIDVNLPDCNGVALCEKLALIGVKMPVIVMTGAASIPLAVDAMRAGAVDFIEKPIDREQLRWALRRAIHAFQTGTEGEADPNLDQFKGKLTDLSPRELEILSAIVSGLPTKTIAFQLGISPRTVHAHRMNISAKLGVSGLSNLLRLSLAAGVRAQHPPN